MSLADSMRRAVRNPKVAIAGGAAAIGVVAIALGGKKSASSDAEGDELAAAATSPGTMGGQLPQTFGEFGGADVPFIDTAGEEALHDRFDQLGQSITGLQGQINGLKPRTKPNPKPGGGTGPPGANGWYGQKWQRVKDARFPGGGYNRPLVRTKAGAWILKPGWKMPTPPARPPARPSTRRGTRTVPGSLG